jgi:hypothetical protein
MKPALLYDVRDAVRTLRSAPIVTAVAILSLTSFRGHIRVVKTDGSSRHDVVRDLDTILHDFVGHVCRALRVGPIDCMADKLSSIVGGALLIALAIGPSFLGACIVWLTWFKGTRLSWRSAAVIFAVAGACSIGMGWHMYMPALVYFVLAPADERLFWFGWMAPRVPW